MPVRIVLPIAGPERGAWFKSGTELLLKQSRVRIFFELPPEYYPLKARITLFDKSGFGRAVGDIGVDEYRLPKPGKIFFFDVPASMQAECLKDIGPESFCSFRIDTHPKWDYHGYKVGFYLFEDSFLQQVP